MPQPILVAKAKTEIFLLPQFANRHGRIAGDNARQFTTQYGNISAASIGAIQRGLLTLEQQGGDKFFAEPALNIADLIRPAREAAGRRARSRRTERSARHRFGSRAANHPRRSWRPWR